MVLGMLAGAAYPLAAEVAVVLFTMGAWHLATFLQLRCVRKLISQLVRQSHVSGAPGRLR